MKLIKRIKPTVYIAVIMLFIMLLSLLALCYEPKFVSSTQEIPEGWEVVSREGNITHLRLQEGSKAYKKKFEYFRKEQNTYFSMTTEFPGVPEKATFYPDENGNVNVIVYYGYYRIEPDSNYDSYALSDELPDNWGTLELHMVKDLGQKDKLLQVLMNLEEYAIPNSVSLQFMDPGQYTVGLSQAVMVSIPISELSHDVKFQLASTNNSGAPSFKYQEGNFRHTTLGNKMFYSIHTKREYFNTTFPYILLREPIYMISILGSLLIISLLVMIISAIKKKSKWMHWIPLLIGMAYAALISWFFYEFFDTGGLFSGLGVDLLLYFTLIAYTVYGCGLYTIRSTIDMVRRRKHTQQALTMQSPEPPNDL